MLTIITPTNITTTGNFGFILALVVVIGGMVLPFIILFFALRYYANYPLAHESNIERLDNEEEGL